MLIALHSEIREGEVPGYLEMHATIPSDLVETFTRVGINDWTIWRSGRRLFHLVDCDDWDAANAELGPDPANVAWQERIGRYVELFRGSDGEDGYAPLHEVWRLAAQVARTPRSDA